MTPASPSIEEPTGTSSASATAKVDRNEKETSLEVEVEMKELELVDAGEKKAKVELPGFSEFAAATGLSVRLSSTSGAEHPA